MVKQSTINKIKKLAYNAGIQRKLTREVLDELEIAGVYIYENSFCDKWSYIEGDCSSEEILSFLMENKI